MSANEDHDLQPHDKLFLFLAIHWKGFVTLAAPIILLFVILPLPAEPYKWVAYTLLVMAVYWVTECIPLAITSFLPIITFPLAGVATTAQVCKLYVNDTIFMFLGSLFLAYSIEQCGLHKRLAYFTISTIGYSHVRLMLAMCCVTTFVSMWITNTAATTMMVPIIFAILRVFESQGLLKVFDEDSQGNKVASDITTCYFCAATFSATIGGIGTLVGTATNIAFKGLFHTEYPNAPERLSFPLFSAFGVPYMIAMEACCYIFLAMVYFGLWMPNSKLAKKTKIPPAGKAAVKIAIANDQKKLGKFTFWEGMVTVLFFGAMICFFCRSPQVFKGWGDIIIEYFGLKNKFILDSSVAALICSLMFILPRSMDFFKNFSAKYSEDLPKGKIGSVLDFPLLNMKMPWSFMFLLGAGSVIARGAELSQLNIVIQMILKPLAYLPNPIIIFIFAFFVIIVTNFASNVAIANILVPIGMQIAKLNKTNPLWYCLVIGFSASFCFMLPVGTPGNLVVQSAAKIPVIKMIKAGSGVTLTTLILTWIFMTYFAPVIWTDLKELPGWAAGPPPN